MKKYVSLFLVFLCSILCLGCGSNEPKVGKHEFVPLKSAGYYSDLRFAPNGEFFVRGKLNEEEAKKHGIVFKVEVDENKRIKQITAMDSGIPINTRWYDIPELCSRDMRIMNGYFSRIIIDYPNNYMILSFKKADSSPGGYYSSSIRYTYDEQRRHPIVAHLYNAKGELYECLENFSTMLFRYNEQGQLEKVGYSDKSGERIVTASKKYETRFKYDKNKHTALPVEIDNYGKDGNFMADENGIAKIAYDFDSKGRLTQVKHFGIDGVLKVRLKNSGLEEEDIDAHTTPTSYRYAAVTKFTYSEDGENPEKVVFYGTNEQRIALPKPEWENDSLKSNVSALAYTYTAEGRIATLSLLGIDDMPCTAQFHVNGRPLLDVVKYANSYDAFGNLECYITYKKGNQIAKMWQYKYDDKRRKIEESYFGADEHPVEVDSYEFDRKYMVHRLVYEYNDDNQRIKTTGYDKSGKIVAERKRQ